MHVLEKVYIGMKSEVFYYCTCGEWTEEDIESGEAINTSYMYHIKEVRNGFRASEATLGVWPEIETKTFVDKDGQRTQLGFKAESVYDDERRYRLSGRNDKGSWDDAGRCQYTFYDDVAQYRCEGNQHHAGQHYVYNLDHGTLTAIPTFMPLKHCRSKRGIFRCEFEFGHDGYHGSGDQAWVSLWEGLGEDD